MNASTYVLSGGVAVKRIRNPNANDVLSGRGGGINSHMGNRTFREWVRERKNAYNLALSKAEKARVAREVIDLVKGLNPPGRFLQRDPDSPASSGYWVEVDDAKAMAKTSQALREGAPMIRAAHKDELEQMSKTRRKKRAAPTSQPTSPALAPSVPPVLSPTLSALSGNYSGPIKQVVPNSPVAATLTQQEERVKPPYVSGLQQQRTQALMQQAVNSSKLVPEKNSAEQAVTELRANAERAKKESVTRLSTGSQNLPAPLVSNNDFNNVYGPPSKKLKIEAEVDGDAPTPPLAPVPAPHVPDGFLPPLRQKTGLKRVHSLALSDLSEDWATEEFVNPFENESDVEDSKKDVQPQTRAQYYAGRYGDNKSGNVSLPSFSSGGLRRKSREDVSSRSFTSELSDLPIAMEGGFAEDTLFDEGMKTVYDAAHPDLTSPRSGDTIPTHLYPYRGGGLALRRSSGLLSSIRGRDGRQ